MHSYFYFLHLEFTIHIILIPQTQKDSLLPPSSPQENYYKVMYFYKVVMAVVVFLRRQVQNQIGTQQQSRIDSWLRISLDIMCIRLGIHVPACRNFPIPRDSDQIGDTRSGIAGTSPLSGFQGKATDAQAVDLNSGLLQGENTELDSGNRRWSGANRPRPP